MITASFPIIAAWTNAAVFALAGIVNLTAFGAVRVTYQRWGIPVGFYRTLGLIEIAAAAFLAAPALRVYGVILAAPIMFGAIVMLLDHSKYLYAAASMLVMAALVPAAVASSQHHSHGAYVEELASSQPQMSIATLPRTNLVWQINGP